MEKCALKHCKRDGEIKYRGELICPHHMRMYRNIEHKMHKIRIKMLNRARQEAIIEDAKRTLLKIQPLNKYTLKNMGEDIFILTQEIRQLREQVQILIKK